MGALPSYPAFSQGLVGFEKAPRPGGRLAPEGLLGMEGAPSPFPVLPDKLCDLRQDTHPLCSPRHSRS